jgi:hypothetical protein
MQRDVACVSCAKCVGAWVRGCAKDSRVVGLEAGGGGAARVQAGALVALARRRAVRRACHLTRFNIAHTGTLIILIRCYVSSLPFCVIWQRGRPLHVN